MLRSLPCTEHKVINGHGLPGHHVSTMIRFSIKKVSNINGYLLSYLRGSLGFNRLFGLGRFLLDGSLFLNRRISKFSETSGLTLCQFVSKQCELVQTSISPFELKIPFSISYLEITLVLQNKILP